MNSDDQTVRLLDAAVPPIPAGLRTPPYALIRARARRRRRTAMICTAAATVAVLVAGVVLTSDLRPRPSTVVGSGTTTAGPSSIGGSAGPVPVPIDQARLDRAGTGLTLYLATPGGCNVFGDATVHVSEGAAYDQLTVEARPVPADCSRAVVTTVHTTIAHALGNRLLRDGYTGLAIRVFPDANLPVVPGPWTEIPADFFQQLDGTFMAVGYTRPGGPDLNITMVVNGSLNPSPVGRVRLGSREGVIDSSGTNSYEVDWAVGDLYYHMGLDPSEGQSVTLNQTHAVIAELTWP